MAKTHVDHGAVTPVLAAATRDVGAETLKYIHGRLQIDEEWTQRRERGFSWWAHRLPQHVDAGRPIDDGGIVVTRITSRIPILHGVTAEPDLVEKVLAEWNFISDSCCYAYDAATRSIDSVQSGIVHEQTLDWRPELLAAGFIIQLCHAEEDAPVLRRALGGRLASSRHPTQGRRKEPDDMLNVVWAVFRPRGTGPSLFADKFEFDTICEQTQRINAASFGASDTGVAIEVPFGRSTALITLNAKEEPKYYYGQLQHILCVTGLVQIDYYSYWPDDGRILITVERDLSYIDRLVEAEEEFWRELKDRSPRTAARSEVPPRATRSATSSVVRVERDPVPIGRAPAQPTKPWNESRRADEALTTTAPVVTSTRAAGTQAMPVGGRAREDCSECAGTGVGVDGELCGKCGGYGLAGYTPSPWLRPNSAPETRSEPPRQEKPASEEEESGSWLERYDWVFKWILVLFVIGIVKAILLLLRFT